MKTEEVLKLLSVKYGFRWLLPAGQKITWAVHLFSGLSLMFLLALPVQVLSGAQGRIEGQVLNGTTHEPVPKQEVRLLVPREGMQRVATAFTDAGGHFAFAESQIDSSSFYLLETEFEGVPYHVPLQFDNSGTASATLTVYGSTLRESGLRIQAARILVRAEGNKVRVQEGFGVQNTSDPPRTYRNPRGTFRFHISPAVSEPKVSVVGLMNMPLPQRVERGKSADEFSIHYSLKPGTTVVVVSYDADYTSSHLTLRDQVPYAIDNAEIYVAPTSLSVNTSVFKPAGLDEANGAQKFIAESLPPSTALELRLAGEAASSTGAESGEGEAEIKILPNSMTKLGVPLLLCFLLLLLWALGVTVSKEWSRWEKWRGAGFAQKELATKVEAMLNSLADLDELFDSGKIAEKKYWKERQSLKARLVAAMKTRPSSHLESYATRRIPQ